ncbi:MAG: hypothetical protein ABSA16_12370 [Thermoguttaceae bacterium]|jgi:hypothetical protein
MRLNSHAATIATDNLVVGNQKGLPTALIPFNSASLILSMVVLVLSGWLLFFRLGHYPLWCDEADTALFARGIARTGDTSALIDHNLYAFRNGSCLKNLHGRYQPPLPYYLAAPFVGTDGTSSFWPRLPFAVCGLLCVALMLFWMSQSRLTKIARYALSIGLLCNVSFFLFCRQCRYYSLGILLSLAIVYLYLNLNKRLSGILWLMLVSVLLLWTQYLYYAALYAAIACDYLLFERHERKWSLNRCLVLLGPQLLIGLATLWIYNPFGAEVAAHDPGENFILDKLELLWWNFRDLNNCEFCAGIVVLIAPIVYYWTRNIWLLRGMAAVICYVAVVTIFSPQSVKLTTLAQADVRYLAPLIPLLIGLSALIIVLLTRNKWFLALPLMILIFGTNVLNYPFSSHLWCSRPVEFIEELWYPRITSIDEAVDWINDHVGNGQSIWVLPQSKEPPLMYHAPHATYAWHLDRPRTEQFAALPLVHFVDLIPPDYIIVFGPFRARIEQELEKNSNPEMIYKIDTIINVYWDEKVRPEIFWHSFLPIENFDRDLRAVYVYRRVKY